MKFQFNKTAMQRIEKDLNIRLRALPTLKAKETALRMEIKKLQREIKSLEEDSHRLMGESRSFAGLWLEYPSLLSIGKTDVIFRNVAGVALPILQNLEFNIREYSLYANRAWVPGATEWLKQMVTLSVRINLAGRSLEILHRARKKTTQKVNLYEKVQIPEFRSAMRKIKRFLEDEENLSKASQKIVKARQEVGA